MAQHVGAGCSKRRSQLDESQARTGSGQAPSFASASPHGHAQHPQVVPTRSHHPAAWSGRPLSRKGRMVTSPADGGNPDPGQAGQHWPGRLPDLHCDRQQVDVEALRLVPTFRHRRRRAALSGPLAGMPAAIIFFAHPAMHAENSPVKRCREREAPPASPWSISPPVGAARRIRPVGIDRRQSGERTPLDHLRTSTKRQKRPFARLSTTMLGTARSAPHAREFAFHSPLSTRYCGKSVRSDSSRLRRQDVIFHIRTDRRRHRVFRCDLHPWALGGSEGDMDLRNRNRSRRCVLALMDRTGCRDGERIRTRISG